MREIMAINDLDQRRACNSEINKVNSEYITNACAISYMLFNCDFLKAGREKKNNKNNNKNNKIKSYQQSILF